MKKSIHPDYHAIVVVMTDGTKFDVGSTWGKPGQELHLEVDPKSHVAWTKEQHFRETGRSARFNQRFPDMGKFALSMAAAKKEQSTE